MIAWIVESQMRRLPPGICKITIKTILRAWNTHNKKKTKSIPHTTKANNKHKSFYFRNVNCSFAFKKYNIKIVSSLIWVHIPEFIPVLALPMTSVVINKCALFTPDIIVRRNAYIPYHVTCEIHESPSGCFFSFFSSLLWLFHIVNAAYVCIYELQNNRAKGIRKKNWRADGNNW